MSLLDDLTNAIAGFQRQLEMRPPGETRTTVQNGIEVRETRFEAQLPGSYEQEKDDSIQGKGSNSGGGDGPPYVPPPARPPPVCPTGGTKTVVFSGISACSTCFGSYKFTCDAGTTAVCTWDGTGWSGTTSGTYTYTAYSPGMPGDTDCDGAAYKSWTGGMRASVACEIDIETGQVVYGASLSGIDVDDGVGDAPFGGPPIFAAANNGPLGTVLENVINSDTGSGGFCTLVENPTFGGTATIS